MVVHRSSGSGDCDLPRNLFLQISEDLRLRNVSKICVNLDWRAKNQQEKIWAGLLNNVIGTVAYGPVGRSLTARKKSLI